MTTTHPDYESVSVADFRAKVACHLSRAQRKIPNVVPADVFDDAPEGDGRSRG